MRARWMLTLALVLTVAALPKGVAGDTGPVTPLPPVTATDGFAGTCYSFYPDPYGQVPGRPFLPLMLAAGSRWDRFDFSWLQLEPREGQWNFVAQDQLVSDLRAAGMNILGILLWTPNWAATGNCTPLPESLRLDLRPDRWPASAFRQMATPMNNDRPLCITTPPRGLYEEWNDWTTADGDPVNTWGRFVYTVAYRYRDSVKYWEVWNEPDLHWFWSGTSTDYAQLLKVAYRAVKAACPDCRVLFGGIAYYEKPDFYRWVLNRLKSDPDAPTYNYFFDAMAIHLYHRSSSIYDVTQSIRNGMREFVPDRPIWLTETGSPVWDDSSVISPTVPYTWSARMDEAAAYVLQSYANARAAGIERYIFFRAHDDYCDKNRDGDCADEGIDYGMGELFGLVRDDRSLRPAYVAFQVATTYLVSPTMVTSVNYSDGVRRVTFWGTPRGKISVLWNTVPTATLFSYPETLPAATLVDQRGVTRTITATNKAYSLFLPGATANNGGGVGTSDYIIGGEPYLVIETDTIPPTATVRSVTVSLPPTVTVSWDGADDAAGIWLYDVQVREGAGAWTNWLTMTPTTSSAYVVPRTGTWCFRARAWDRAGNRGDWSPELCAAVTLTRTVHLTVDGVFGDEDGDGARGPDEPTITATMRLLSPAGVDVVSPTMGTSWEFTATLPVGIYTLEATPESWPSPPPGWLPRRMPVEVYSGVEPQEVFLTIGLRPHRASVYLPIVRRGVGA
ncbi:MAG: hypothetical protein H5T61_01980 [Thermoflexales bacterium]|nr:hypothetical protein [Thermoflexales bacterium]